jgi:phospholipase C
MALRFDRRTALRSFGALAAGGLMVGCGQKARPLAETIDNVVVLMMENRTFDHYFGSLKLVEGRAEVDGLDATMFNPRSNGERVMPHLADKSCVIDLPHGWNRSHLQWNDGKNDGFVAQYEDAAGDEGSHRAMGYLDRSMVPASYALADEYVLCQRWFASLMTSTWPNRFYSLAAQNGGIQTNDKSVTYDFLTIYDRLKAAGRSYGIYYGNISFSLLLARDYPRDNFHELEQFFDDAEAGTLPNLSIIEPLYGRNDDHPPAHPLAGQVLIASIYDALARSPQWNRTLFVINYDEHGGFFDHVPPPKTADAFAADGFDQLGFRVPAMVIGPYAQARVASNTVFDHSSTLKFLAELYGMKTLTERDAAANSLTGLLDSQRIEDEAPRPATPIPQIIADEAEIYAPECLSSIGLVTGPSSDTGQLELEQYLNTHPELAWADRRRSTAKTYDALLRRAEKRGLLKIRTSQK